VQYVDRNLITEIADRCNMINSCILTPAATTAAAIRHHHHCTSSRDSAHRCTSHDPDNLALLSISHIAADVVCASLTRSSCLPRHFQPS